MSRLQPSLFEGARMTLPDAIDLTKICSRCKQEKPLSEFKNDRTRKDGRYPQCRSCEREYRDANIEKIKEHKKEFRETNSEKIKASKHQYYLNNSDKLKEKGRAHYVEHREEIIATAREYYKSNFETVRLSKQQYYRANRERALEYLKVWRFANKQRIAFLDRRYRENHREEKRDYERQYYARNPHIEKAKKHRRRALIQAGGSFTSMEFKALCEHYENRCLSCGEVKKLTPDHVIPLSKGGSNTISNIQPLCLDCNIHKGIQSTDYRARWAGTEPTGDIMLPEIISEFVSQPLIV